MARVSLTKTTATPNFTDMTYETMVAGTDNGVYYTHDREDQVVLLNDTGGPAVYTLITRTFDIETYGVVITDATITVADGKTFILPSPPAELFRDDNGLVQIDCDVAGKIAVLSG